MTNPIDHSSASIRVVLAFLDFLYAVKDSFDSENDQERLLHAMNALLTLFKISPPMLHQHQQHASTSNSAHKKAPSFSIGSTVEIDFSLWFLFHQFFFAVQVYGFNLGMLSFDQHPLTQIRRAKQIFKDAIEVLTEAGHETFDHKNLSEGLKILGNKAMHTKLNDKAIEMYSIAIVLSKDNAVYFCNRAAAFSKVRRFEEAIRDCNEAIRLNRGYVLAYYRLGCAYYEQGKNLEAIREGFLKVLELEPNNADAMVCLQLADSRVEDEVASLRKQMGKLRVGPAVTGKRPPSPGQSTVLMFREPEEGGNGPWELVEDMGNANNNDNDEETISVAEFIDTHLRNIPPPE